MCVSERSPCTVVQRRYGMCRGKEVVLPSEPRLRQVDVHFLMCAHISADSLNASHHYHDQNYVSFINTKIMRRNLIISV